MLKKENRLAKARDIQKTLAEGRSFFNPFFTIKHLPTDPTKRFSVVVSTKVFKKAVARNRLKRLIREHLRKNLHRFRNGSFVIIVKPKTGGLPEKEIMAKFYELCAKLR